MAVGDAGSVDKAHIIADSSAAGLMLLDIFLNQFAEDTGKLGILLILDHECSDLRVQATKEHDISVAVFVQNRDNVALSESGVSGCLDCAYVANQTVVADSAVVDVVANVLDEAVVADDNVSQNCVVDA